MSDPTANPESGQINLYEQELDHYATAWESYMDFVDDSLVAPSDPDPSNSNQRIYRFDQFQGLLYHQLRAGGYGVVLTKPDDSEAGRTHWFGVEQGELAANFAKHCMTQPSAERTLLDLTTGPGVGVFGAIRTRLNFEDGDTEMAELINRSWLGTLIMTATLRESAHFRAEKWEANLSRSELRSFRTMQHIKRVQYFDYKNTTDASPISPQKAMALMDDHIQLSAQTLTDT